MAFNVTEFRTSLLQDGARPNLFSVSIPFPSQIDSSTAGQVLPFLAKAASLPSSDISVVTQQYFGREFKFAGVRRFTDWRITIINDENFIIRNAFEKWLNMINSHTFNQRDPLANNPTAYTSDATVIQYSKAGPALKTYKFVGMFPTSVSDIRLNWGADEIEEFDVSFSYQYWEDDVTT